MERWDAAVVSFLECRMDRKAVSVRAFAEATPSGARGQLQYPAICGGGPVTSQPTWVVSALNTQEASQKPTVATLWLNALCRRSSFGFRRGKSRQEVDPQIAWQGTSTAKMQLVARGRPIRPRAWERCRIQCSNNQSLSMALGNDKILAACLDLVVDVNLQL